MPKIKRKRNKKFFRKKFILSVLAQAGKTTLSGLLDILSGVGELSEKMLLPYNSSYSAFRLGGRRSFNNSFDFAAEKRRARTALLNLLSRLNKEGLVDRIDGGNILITDKGLNSVEIKSPTPPWFKIYKRSSQSNKKSGIKLIIFDIPEKDRIKRDWLRFKLEQLGFRKMQMSVWWGRGALPEEFIADLAKYEILPHVHILAVSQRGIISTFLERIGAA